MSYVTDTCCTTHTPTVQPYIDLISPRLGVALGGNGYAAKSCDEFGRMAVDYLMSGAWSSDLPQAEFKFRARNMMSKL